jgi:hypothetical protein
MQTKTPAFCTCLTLLLLSAPNVRADLIGVTWDLEDGAVYRIDEITGDTELIGYSGLSRMNSLAQDSRGILFTVGSLDTGPGPSNVLATIDPLTGAARVIGPLTGLTGVNVTSMAFSPDGILFAYHEKLHGTGDRIIAINPSTAEVAVIAEVGPVDEHGVPLVQALMGLDFGPDGLLYGWGTDGDRVGLVLVDPFTGFVMDVDPTVDATAPLQTLVFLEDGTLLGHFDSTTCGPFSCNIQGTLVMIDPVDGSQTVLSTNVAGDIRGLAVYRIPDIPEIPVQIDLKPGDDFNTINPGSAGVIPVAILSTGDFDATTIDPATVRLAGAEVAVRGKGQRLARAEDVNKDGLLDLVCQVETVSLTLDPDVGEVWLTGETRSFERVVGLDVVLIVPVRD